MFRKLAYSREVLRALSGEMVKEAILGRIAGAAMKNPLGTASKALTAVGVASELKGGMAKGRAFKTGFDPAIQAWQSTPVGGH